MDYQSTIGAELELHLIDANGFLVPEGAKLALNDPRTRRENGSYWLVYEGTHAQIEVNSDPALTIDQLHHDLERKLQTVEEICLEKGMFPVTASEYGAGRGVINENAHRNAIYRKILGERKANMLPTPIGTHTHIAQAPDDERKLYQIRLLKGVEPLSPALTSTSPIRYDGRNSLNNHRINLHRYNVFSEFPFHAQLQDYPESLGVINERNVQLVEIWQRVAAREGITPTEFLKEFQPHNTGYAPIRKRDYFGPTGTWEVRSADATPLYHLSDNSALIKGINDYAMSRHIPVIVAEQDGFYEFTPNRFVVPNHRTGLAMEQAYIDKGLETHPKYGDLMVDFLRTILPYAEEGLPSEDKPYLAPAWEMANTQMNPSSQLIHELHKKRKFRRHQYTPKMSAHANLIAREMYVAGLNN